MKLLTTLDCPKCNKNLQLGLHIVMHSYNCPIHGEWRVTTHQLGDSYDTQKHRVWFTKDHKFFGKI